MTRRRRNLGWVGLVALGLGGANQSLESFDTLLGGQGGIAGQGGAAVLLLAAGFLLVCLAAPGWLELVLMSPGRVGGIGAACTAAFRPYSPVIGAIAGLCSWWGWTATCGLAVTAVSDIVVPLFFPATPPWAVSACLLAGLVGITLLGLRASAGFALVLSLAVAVLVVVAILAPIEGGLIHPVETAQLTLDTALPGPFGQMSAIMAGMFQVGYAAPAIEGVLFFVAETRAPVRNVRRALVALVAIGAIFFLVLPGLWFSALGGPALSVPMDRALGPVLAPMLGPMARAGAVGLSVFCWLQTALLGFAGTPRTLEQLSFDGMAPRLLSHRSPSGVPVGATLLTAFVALVIAMINDSIWLQGAANFAYLISLVLPGIAVWLLRRDWPAARRPWRAPTGMIAAGLAAGGAWLVIAALGFQQFNLAAMLLGLAMAYSGVFFFALRKIEDDRRRGVPHLGRSIYMDVMMTLMVVLALDSVGYVVALERLSRDDPWRVATLEDIFVAVAIISVSVGVLLPGRVARTAQQLSHAARQLATGPLKDLSIALESLGRGDLDGARLASDITPLPAASSRELTTITMSINSIQTEVRQASIGLERARQGLATAREELTRTNLELRERIAEQERLTQEVVSARDAATAGERSKAEFLAVISHELRTPLNGVIGLAGLLMDGALDPQARQYAGMLRDAGDHLLSVINDLLDFTKLEAGRLEFERINFELDAVVQSALELLAHRASAKSLEIGAFVSPDIPPVLVGDPGRLRQILLNLISNGIKFTEAGSVTLSVTLARRTADEVILGFAVADTGMGIREEDMPCLFQQFNQLDSSVSRRFGGTGLGLAICQRLVAGMGGEISAHSTFGHGAEFSFSVTLAIGEHSGPDSPRGSARLSGDRILLLAGNGIGGRLLARQIRSRGGVVHRAGDFATGLDMLRQLAGAGTPCRTVLIDNGLTDLALPGPGSGSVGSTAPGLGTEGLVAFARQLRGDPQLKQTRLMLTSNAPRPGEGEIARSDLFDCVLVKPVPMDSLVHRLQGLGAAAPSGRDVAAPIERKQHHLRILVAEDNQTNQAVIKAMMSRLGYRIDIVGNGLEALQAVRERPYDLVLMDVMMPEMDGIAATREIRALPGKAASIPVFALTADVASDHHADFYAAGMQAVLLKPITLQALQAALSELEPRLTEHA